LSKFANQISDTKDAGLNILKLLESVGLTKSQALVYLELVKRQTAEASTLCDETGIKNSKIYAILNRLEKLGLIIVETTKPKKYRVNLLEEGLENLSTVIREEYDVRIKTLEELKVRLTPLFDSISSITEFALIIKGYSHIINHITTKIDLAGNNVVFIAPNVEIYELFKESINELLKENIIVRVGIYKPINLTKESQTFEILPMSCELFYVIIDNNYLIMVSEWEHEDHIYAIVTSDRNLIHMSLNYLETPTCMLDHKD